MPNFNKIILLGSLVAKPELRYSPGGNAFCNLRLAVRDTHRTVDGGVRDWEDVFDVVCYGKQAETIANYLDAGSPLLVEGRLSRGEEDRDARVIMRSFEFVPARGMEVSA